MTMQIVIDTAQTHISVKDDCFYIRSKKTNRKISPKRVSSIAITSNAYINASAIILAAKNQVPILYFNNLGEVMARMTSPYFSNLASLRRKQLVWSIKSEAGTFFIESLQLKFSIQSALLKSLQHNKKTIPDKSAEFIATINNKRKAINNLKAYPPHVIRNKLMGIEGGIGKKYWQCIAHYLPAEFTFKQRSRRPAKDIFNAALNYLYGMTYSVVESAVFAAGLDPLIGCLHTENYYKTSLVFDVIEPFRPLVDKLLVQLFMQSELEKKHFTAKDSGFLLNRSGKKVLIPAYNEYLAKRMLFNEKITTFKNHIYFYCQNMAQQIKTMPDDLLDHV